MLTENIFVIVAFDFDETLQILLKHIRTKDTRLRLFFLFLIRDNSIKIDENHH